MAKEMTQQERRQEAIRSVQEQFDARPPRGARPTPVKSQTSVIALTKLN